VTFDRTINLPATPVNTVPALIMHLHGTFQKSEPCINLIVPIGQMIAELVGSK
jgi:hypothetical protein